MDKYNDDVNNKRVINNGNNKGNGLSSASLLAQIKARKVIVENDRNKQDENGRKKVQDLKEKRYEILVRDLYNYFKNSGDLGVESDKLIEQFDHRLINEQEQYMFKIILQKMCRLKTDTMNNKAWVLKDKYQSL